MNSNQNDIVEESGRLSLKKGYPVLVGIPAYGIKKCIFRLTHPLSPEDLFGLSDPIPSDSILDDYENKYGYHFSWGTVSETTFTFDDEKGHPTYAHFEFAPRDVYLAFPDGWHLSDLFSWMYRRHPLCHPKFKADPDNVTQDWCVITLEAKNSPDIMALRNWLADVFIPVIWPDLLREAMQLIEAKKEGITSPESFDKLLSDRSRYLLCPKPQLSLATKRPVPTVN